MDPAWYVKVKDKKYGPFTQEKLSELVRAGKLTLESPARSTSSAGWSTVGLVLQPAVAEPAPSEERSPDPVEVPPASTSTPAGPSRWPTIALLTFASIVGIVVHWLDLYLPALRLSLSVITAASVALVLKHLASIAFASPKTAMSEERLGNRRELATLLIIAGTAGSLLVGLSWHGSKSALAGPEATKKAKARVVAPPAEDKPKFEPEEEKPAVRPVKRSGPTAAELAEQKRQQENAQALDLLGQILQGAANDNARANQGTPCPACGGKGSYSYVDGFGQLQVSRCPHCSGSGKKWGGNGFFGP